jgi:hypothetical protein
MSPARNLNQAEQCSTTLRRDEELRGVRLAKTTYSGWPWNEENHKQQALEYQL